MLDWDDLRFFLAVARHGSLTAASKELRVAQSTVGRRLASLETSLGVRLLHRTPDGYVLTLAGEGVRSQAERVEAEALALERTVGGHDTKLEGTVRITCTETVACRLLAPCFVQMHARHPDILVELVPDPTQLSLSMREADIAVWLSPPDQNDLVVRRIGRIGFGLYAAPSYLELYGEPAFEAGCAGHRIMTLMSDPDSDAQARWLTDLTPRAELGFQTSSHEALLSATKHGGGLACLARFHADSEPGLLRLATPAPAPATDMWLLVHKDSRATPRIRAALSIVVEAAKAAAERLDPQDEAASQN